MKNYFWNMITNIKNGQLSKRNCVYLQKKTNLCESMLKILWDEGFLIGYRSTKKDKKKLKIFLKYTKNDEPAINVIKFISKPGRRVYMSINQIWKIDTSKALIIFSTNKGLKTISDCKKQGIGGEPLIAIN